MSNKKYNGWTNYPTWRINLDWFEDSTIFKVSRPYEEGPNIPKNKQESSKWYRLSETGFVYVPKSVLTEVYDLTAWCKKYVIGTLTDNAEEKEADTIHYTKTFLKCVNWREIASLLQDNLIYTELTDIT